MSAVIPTNTMPALGVQLASMVSCVETCRTVSSNDEDVSTWRQARNDVFEPFRLEYVELPVGAYAAENGLNDLIPQVRKKFDERVGRLYRQPVTKPVIDDQRIDVDIVKRAREFKLISELPANALIQSALTCGAQKEKDVLVEKMSLAMLGNVGSFALGIGGAIFAFMHDAPAVGIAGVLLAIVLGIVLVQAAKSENNLTRTEIVLAEKWNEIFPDREA